MCTLSNAGVFRLPDITASFSDELPDAQVSTSADDEKIPKIPLLLTSSSSSSITEQFVPDVSSITYHPNPLIVSSCCFMLSFFNAKLSSPVWSKILCPKFELFL